MNYHSVLFGIPHSSQPFFRPFFLGLIESDVTVVIELCCRGQVVVVSAPDPPGLPSILLLQICSNPPLLWRFGFFQRPRVGFSHCSSWSFGLVPRHQSRPYLFPSQNHSNSSEVAARRGGERRSEEVSRRVLFVAIDFCQANIFSFPAASLFISMIPVAVGSRRAITSRHGMGDFSSVVGADGSREDELEIVPAPIWYRSRESIERHDRRAWGVGDGVGCCCATGGIRDGV